MQGLKFVVTGVMTHLTREQVEDLVMTYGGKVCVCVCVCVCVRVCVFIHHSLVLTVSLLICPPHIWPLQQSIRSWRWLNYHTVECQCLNLHVVCPSPQKRWCWRAWMSSAYTVPSFLPHSTHVPSWPLFFFLRCFCLPTNQPSFLPFVSFTLSYYYLSLLYVLYCLLPSLLPSFLPSLIPPSARILDATFNADCKRSIGQNKLSSCRNSLGWWSTSRWEQQVQNCDRKKGT